MKLLFIRYKKSKNILEGGEQGSQKNYNVLSKIIGEDNIDTYYIHDENKKKTVNDYLHGFFYFFKSYYFGLTPNRVKDIIDSASIYDYVFIDRSVFGIIAKELKKAKYQGQVICFFHNVEKLYFAAKIPWYMPWRQLILNCVDKNDKLCCQYGDKIIALNARDNEELKSRYHRGADVLIPVAFNDKYKAGQHNEILNTSKKPKCLFLGAFFRPNNEGIEWFIKNVYPYVDIQLQIVGKGMAKLKEKDFILPEIEVIENVPDLTPYFENADVMILPIFKGSGMKVKTCESLMYGKNILATDEALVGYEVDDDKIGGRCNNDIEFIDKINDFIKNPRPKFNMYSRNLYLEKYSEQAVEKLFRSVL
ncbi:MAG: glycosyltransferase [Prevotellaceae bacterium]|nr:glycosyltransferase [Prevotellaceae bacterium]